MFEVIDKVISKKPCDGYNRIFQRVRGGGDKTYQIIKCITGN